MDHDGLITLARETMEQAYAPYSEFRVGAALLGLDGSVHTGCNVENASYGLTVCAERAAVVRAVSQGVREYVGIAIVTEGSEPVTPCGACRQVLAEFAPELTIVSEAGDGRKDWILSELLPEPFRARPRSRAERTKSEVDR